MSLGTKYSALLRRMEIARLNIREYLPERQIYFRTKGKLHFYTLSTTSQTAFTGTVAMGVMSLLVMWTVDAFSEDPLAMRDRKIAAVSEENTHLKMQIDELSSGIQTRAAVLEERQRYMEEVLSQELNGLSQTTAAPIGKAEAVPGATEESASSAASPSGKTETKADESAQLHRDTSSIIALRMDALAESQTRIIRDMDILLRTNIDKFERLFEVTGLKGEDIISYQQDNPAAQGGPLVPYKEISLETSATTEAFAALVGKVERTTLLHNTVRRMPLSKPVTHYYVSSKFGRRRDPFKGYWALHGGLDMAGVRRTPVSTTADGLVTFAGRNGPYGRMVEIDHGNGFKTRYGHLASILVKKGEKVDLGDRIALMGNSGRSSGTHLHYEVRFNEAPLNPEKFFEAAKHVQTN